MTQVDEHPAAVITQSAVAHAGRVYVGVSSIEEFYAGLQADYPCCGFRGSVVALDAETGAILWRTYTVPDVAGFSGNAVWGSTPVVDVRRGSLYSGATVNSGPAVVDGSVYWGSGYPLLKGGTADNELYAFRLARLGDRSPPLP